MFDAKDQVKGMAREDHSRLFEAVKVQDDDPQVRGMLGDMPAQEVVELRAMLNRVYGNEAGLLNYPHFLEQRRLKQARLARRIKTILSE